MNLNNKLESSSLIIEVYCPPSPQILFSYSDRGRGLFVFHLLLEDER
jgi:hypothetical protein